ncbi:hypothetical protein [Streptomyces sp. NPDC047014]|uniref:hypothetical protein n=1 Tax=Streptomyces sp. NPDC047014 TaxID=3155736 RepID=UPI0033C76A9B
MGIESDHLVYAYLSSVGDLAQRRQLSSADRMRLVAGLRDEIDRRRAKYEPETPAAVRRILERIGTPEEVLDGLGTRADPAPPADTGVSAVPAQRAARPAPPARENVPPHLAGLDELGPSGGAEPDWWRLTPGTYGRGPQVDGFAGGVEFPEGYGEEDPEAAGEAEAPAKEADPEPEQQTLVRFLRERRRARAEAAKAAKAAPAPPVVAAAPAARPRPNALLLLAAAVLVAGVLSGYWLLLVIGWLLPFASRVLGPAERKWAVLGPPGLVLAGAGVWLWGRTDGRWGEALTEDQLGGALHGMWPWLLRTAALASVVYLLWRSRRT